MTILYFAWVRQKAGHSEERIELPATVKTVGEVAAFLRARGGGYEEAFGDTKRLRCAVNREHTGWDTAVGADDEVAFFPPVTGG